jgi:gliding motility-associated-like protein
LKSLVSFIVIFFLSAPSWVVALTNSTDNLNVDFSATNVCFGNATTLINLSTITGDSIRFKLWDLNGDGKFDDTTGDTVTYIFSPGTHEVGLKVISWNGVAKAIYKLVSVGELHADFLLENGCVNQQLQFTDKSIVTGDIITSRIWDFGDGSVPSHQQNPVHPYTSSGNFSVKLVVASQSGCSDSITQTLSIIGQVSIDLKFSGDTTFLEGDSVIAYVQGSYDSVKWSTGAKSTSIVIKTKGSYWVRAYVGGCYSTKSFNIQVNKYGSGPVIMTLFTPNGDGMNDRWEILNLLSVGPCEATVYSRSGDKVFSNSVYGNEWDGTYKGKALANDTYYYFVRCYDNTLLQGTVNILK